eukprot:351133_1
MFGYKTKPCTNRPCANMRYWTNYYHEQERSRSPKDLGYNAEPCPNVKCPAGSIGPGKWREPSRCKKGDMCCFAHTLLEQMYHPHIYKTILCTIYAEPPKPETRGRQCMCGYLCTDAHCKDDTRTDPWKPFVSKSAASATTSSRRDVSGAPATTSSSSWDEEPRKGGWEETGTGRRHGTGSQNLGGDAGTVREHDTGSLGLFVFEIKFNTSYQKKK